MEVGEFTDGRKPCGRGSRQSSITPFRDQVLRLKKEGYSDDQVRLFLAENGLRVTQPTISRFLAKQRLIIKTATENSSSDIQTSQVLIKPVNESKAVIGSISQPITKPRLGDNLIDKPPEKASIGGILSEMDLLDSSQ